MKKSDKQSMQPVSNKQTNLFIDWYTNLLYDKNAFEKLLQDDVVLQSDDLLNWLTQNYNPDKFKKLSESQLEDSFIKPLIAKLDWNAKPQIVEKVQGLLKKPDWGLFINEFEADQYFELKKSDSSLQKQLDCISVFLEAKAFGIPLDKGANKNEQSPHFQIIQYLQMFRKQYGFLTNGQHWRFYDVQEISQTKAYIEIDLTAILKLPDLQDRLKAISLFVRLFAQFRYIKNSDAEPSQIEQFAIDAYHYSTEAEENLKSVIYGTNGEDSMFEIIGKSIYLRSPAAELNQVYDNSIILLFRLLFIVYFEDKNKDLLSKHEYYNDYSLQHIFDSVENASDTSKFDGFVKLRTLFKILDEGEENFDIPLFNGGLFDPERAPLLQVAKIFDNGTLRKILEQLLYKIKRKTTLFEQRRDYRNMSVTHLGRIYEGLLEFTFEIPEQSATYLTYQIGNGSIEEAYFDDYDLAIIKSQKGFKEISSHHVNQGDFILKNANNSRKSSASYYTPTKLTQYLVKKGIDAAIESGKPIDELKIIDNACGSGHFLVESLNYLTYVGMTKLHETPTIQNIVKTERKKIESQINSLNIKDYELKDEQILKRALLKRCIFGVDLNPFAVELARLSLWIDSFIFGTPLSFIEHHIQHGNALMGSTEKEFLNRHQAYEEYKNKHQSLDFGDTMNIVFVELKDASDMLSNLQDTSTEDVNRSKTIYKNTIKPRLEQLSRSLNLISMLDIMMIEGQLAKSKTIKQMENLKFDVFFGIKHDTKDDKRRKQIDSLFAEIDAYQSRFNFFHYEIAFPEARNGFDVIVGNPPWDKTKFSDTDFFPYYNSRYRSMSNSEKKLLQENLFDNPEIKSDYEHRAKETLVANAYLKNKFPLNSGSGDGNLFRFFVEKNLSLLANGGSLNYVLPSALMFEEGSQALRANIITNYKMPFFYSFENREKLFPDVDSRYKFAMMQLIKIKPEDNEVVSTAYYITNPDSINNVETLINYPIQLLKQLSPAQWSMMELRNAKDLGILEKCYKAFKPLSETWIDFRNELHMTSDKDLFFEKKSDKYLPLYEGKMIWQFDSNLSTAQHWLDADSFDQRMYSKEIHRMAQSLGNTKNECAALYSNEVAYDREYFRLGFRDIASDTNERTLIFSLIPKNCGVGNTINTSIPKNYRYLDGHGVVAEQVSYLRVLFCLAWFNSLPVDWIARFMIQIHANKTYLFRLPMPQPSDEEILKNTDYSLLAKNALLLQLAKSWDDFSELANIFGIEKADIPTNDKAFDKLRYENDCIVAKLYGMDKSELRYILESFHVMKSKRHGFVSLFSSK